MGHLLLRRSRPHAPVDSDDCPLASRRPHSRAVGDDRWSRNLLASRWKAQRQQVATARRAARVSIGICRIDNRVGRSLDWAAARATWSLWRPVEISANFSLIARRSSRKERISPRARSVERCRGPSAVRNKWPSSRSRSHRLIAAVAGSMERKRPPRSGRHLGGGKIWRWAREIKSAGREPAAATKTNKPEERRERSL